jgi:hypothetical protein
MDSAVSATSPEAETRQLEILVSGQVVTPLAVVMAAPMAGSPLAPTPSRRL